MNKNLLKTFLVAVGLAAGVSGAWAQEGWSTIYSEDYNDVENFNPNGFWTSENTGRYTVQQTQKADGDYVMEAVPVGNGNNGTKVSYSGLTSSNPAVAQYLESDQYRVSFEFNFCDNDSQHPYFQIMDSEGTEIIGFYSLGSGSGTLRLRATGASDTGNELQTYTISDKHTIPTAYNTVVFYTKDNGTYMDVTWAGKTEVATYTIDASNVIHIGKLVHNTKRYWNHFVFDNLNVQIYSETELVAAPQARVTAINGVSRTIAITSLNESYTIYYYFGEDSSNPIKYAEPISVSESGVLHYYAQSASGAKSEIQELSINCVAVTLSAPSIQRAGAN